MSWLPFCIIKVQEGRGKEISKIHQAPWQTDFILWTYLVHTNKTPAILRKSTHLVILAQMKNQSWSRLLAGRVVFVAVGSVIVSIFGTAGQSGFEDLVTVTHPFSSVRSLCCWESQTCSEEMRFVLGDSTGDKITRMSIRKPGWEEGTSVLYGRQKAIHKLLGEWWLCNWNNQYFKA